MRRLGMLLALACAAGNVVPATASAADEFDQYRLESASVSVSTTQAGAHPDFTTTFDLSQKPSGEPFAFTRDVVVELPPGLIGNADVFPHCTVQQLGFALETSKCPLESQVGVIDVTVTGSISGTLHEPIYNLSLPGTDSAARFGFFAGLFPVLLNVRLNPETQALVASVESAPSDAGVTASSATFWGVPSAPAHDGDRITPSEAAKGGGDPRDSTFPEIPFMTNPTNCHEPREVRLTLRSYQLPGSPTSLTAPFPDITGCGLLQFNPTATLVPTTSQGTTGSGLDYEMTFPSEGYKFGNLEVGSELRRAEVKLPVGMTINPSEAEGLGVCSEADLSRETYNSGANAGCPETSKIGTVVATTPVLDAAAVGSLYLAKPYDNRFGSLLAIYMTLKVPERGVLIRLAGRVILDPVTGQITTIFEDLPQLPVSSFKLHFREGERAPLVTPSSCGSYQTASNLTPWSAPTKPVQRLSSFGISSGPGFGPCPAGGLPPFRPMLEAGTVNNAAGSYSPFNVRLTRTDPEQEMTHFSIKLPPGLVAKLAGVPLCSDLGVAQAKSRTGIHGGEEELNAPSCPAASQIGTSWAGAGVGGALTYVPGKLYLAGPYHGAPISVVSITAAKAGPFDLGTVVVREALRVNPETAEVFVDAAGSDPIPHIINGVPVHLRDIRVYVDRPEFALNPTDCTPTSTASTVLGSGLDFASEADDRPFTVTTRFQAADCGALPFKPKLRLSLRGSTHRAATPAFRAELTMKPGEANIDGAQVTLPHSEFLDQGHIGTICTRVEFNAGSVPGAGCPRASVYGYARAFTPLLDQPLEGLVFLRSNGGERDLPDLVATLNGQEISIAVVGYIDSVNGRIRNTFATVPDAPVSKFVLSMYGGKKGLLQNSTNICRGHHRAIVRFRGQNGKQHNFRSELKASCHGAKNKK